MRRLFIRAINDQVAEAAFSLLIAAALGTGLCSWANSDDFYIFKVMQTSSAWAHAVAIYRTWSGRFVTTLLINSITSILDITHTNLGVSVLAVLFGAVMWSLACLVTQEKRAWAALIFFLTFWFGFQPVIQAVTLWYVGGWVYTVPWLLGTAWLLLFRQKLRQASSLAHAFLFVVLSVVVGNGIELLSPCLAAIALFWMLGEWRKMPFSRRCECGLGLGGVTLGALLLVIAPGNLGRYQFEMGKPYNFHFHAFELLRAYAGMLQTFFGISLNLLLASVLGALGFFVIAPPKNGASSASGRCEPFLYLGAALLSVVPMALAPELFAPRNTVFFATFMSLAIWELTRQMAGFLFKFKNEPIGQLASTLTLAFAACGVISLVSDWPRALAVRGQFLQRHERLLAQRGSSGIVREPPYHGARPRYQYQTDLGEKDNYWISRNLQTYYSISKIELGLPNSRND